MELQASAMDFVGFSLIDGIKVRSMPSKGEFVENGVVALSYNFIIHKPAKVLTGYLPSISAPYAEEIVKFFAEGTTQYLYKYIMSEPISASGIALKQLLNQGGQAVITQLK